MASDAEQAQYPQRRIERLDGESWTVVSMGDLKVGDRFRMFEADGTPDEDGAISTVAAPPIPNPEVPGRWKIQVV